MQAFYEYTVIELHQFGCQSFIQLRVHLIKKCLEKKSKQSVHFLLAFSYLYTSCTC